MERSANGYGGARERRRNQTYAALTTRARELTAERGLTGFTVEELCEDVGVSRRTFFNYFPSKEDAILGTHEANPFTPFGDAFVASAGNEPATKLTDALLELFTGVFVAMDVPRADPHTFMAAMHAEPALMRRMMQTAMNRERELARLIAKRQGIEPDDGFARAAATMSSHLAMLSFREFIGHAPPCPGAPAAPEAADDESSETAFARFSTILAVNFRHLERLVAA